MANAPLVLLARHPLYTVKTMAVSPDEARIFVGADRSQQLAVKVLEFSIARRTDMKVVVRDMRDLDLPEPEDVRQRKRTGFSFTRFAIPELAGWNGRALYLDADMLVLRDLRELYCLPFDGAKVLIQDELTERERSSPLAAPKKRPKQCSVMMLDCTALDWDVHAIIRGLDGLYTYEELMQDLCILDPEDIGLTVPSAWNSLEAYEPGITGLIHYTDMPTQPWVNPANVNGWLWLNEVREMLAGGALRVDEIQEEVALGHVRPSLLVELDLPPQSGLPDSVTLAHFRKIDKLAGYLPHAEVLAQIAWRAAQGAGGSQDSLLSRSRRAIRAVLNKLEG